MLSPVISSYFLSHVPLCLLLVKTFNMKTTRTFSARMASTSISCFLLVVTSTMTACVRYKQSLLQPKFNHEMIAGTKEGVLFDFSISDP